MEDTTNGCKVCIYEWSSRRGVYVEKYLAYIRRGKENKVLKLKKALYGSKQALQAWNERINYFEKNGYEQCPFEHALYLKKHMTSMLFVTLYVDDLIFMKSKV